MMHITFGSVVRLADLFLLLSALLLGKKKKEQVFQVRVQRKNIFPPLSSFIF